MKLILVAFILLMLMGPVNGQQTAEYSDVAANMTYVLNNITGVDSSYVQIKPNLCLFEVTAQWFTNKVSIDTVNKGVAELYAEYLKQHTNYSGNLTLNMYTVADGLIMNETVTNEDARANYAFIDYVMVKSLNIIKTPEIHDPRSEGIRTPMGY
jgi:hypothetical protein